MPVDRRIQSRRNRHKNNENTNNNTSNDKHLERPNDAMEANMQEADRMWSDLKKKLVDDPSFAEKPDNEKVDIYQKSEFKDFYTNFPIVCRYMICMGQFSHKAFKRFLLKCKSMETKKGRGSDAAEDEWVKRQADYVRYLWESYQKQHFNTNEAQNVWQHAYQTLTQEFKDFKEMHKDVEEKLKHDNIYNKSSMVKELIQRLSNQEQSLDENTTNDLIKKLKERVNNQRRKSVLEQINTEINKIPPTRVSRGSRKDLQSSKEDSKSI